MKTTLVLAMTADGKITDTSRSSPKFTSERDYAHLELQVALADAVLMGGGTLRDGGSAMRVMSPALLQARMERGQPPQPPQIICSRSGKIDPTLPFFSQPIPRWLLTNQEGARGWTEGDKFDRVFVVEDESGEIDWPQVRELFTGLGITNLCFLGGGELSATLFAADFIDELWLTVCPFIYGGSLTPTPTEGAGFTHNLAPRLELLSVEKVENEIFLHYRVSRDSVDSSFHDGCHNLKKAERSI
jgi:5-amino-6-(5-phosphoribosylamino)uracil reductase